MDHGKTNELILELLHANSNGRRQNQLQSLSESEWQGISRQSTRHCIAPLIYHRLKALDKAPGLPDGVMSGFRNVNLYFTAKNIRFFHELGRALKILGDGVPVLLLKGAHLAAFVYRDISLRLMVDLDILVRKADLHKIEKTMREIGFARSMENPDHPYHVAYIDSTRTVVVEVHWHICSEPTQAVQVDIEELWRDARSEVFKGKTVLVLRPEHLLLHICLHDGGQHFYLCGLRTFCDIDAIIRRYREEIDWEVVVSSASKWGITKSAYLTLRLAKEMMGAEVPEEVLTAIKPQDFKQENLVWARKAIFAPLSQDERVSEHFAQFWGAEQYKSKMALFLANIFLPLELMAKIYSVPLGSPYIYLYYPWRFIELSMRYGRSVGKISDEGSDLRIGLEAEHSRILLREWLKS
ncbi:MAG: hypothetical protein CVU57_29265 [Deltaproteobacteria bacterium HGW-Deltaproteobacteria-15]|nr:MAG: hypothetical protein CVU57_29265 [Deltaproteobacteria bacterium HGW-Deltaproteobacteria-15]